MTAEGMPRFVEPMLARSGRVPDGNDWALEVKFDGMRPSSAGTAGPSASARGRVATAPPSSPSSADR